jgi:hypothetical protein
MIAAAAARTAGNSLFHESRRKDEWKEEGKIGGSKTETKNL